MLTNSLKGVLLASWGLTGCAGSTSTETDEVGVGTVALPLTSYGASGTKYQLRHANFDITPDSYYYGYGYGSGGASTGGAPGQVPAPITVSSESNPEAASIDVDLEQGSYMIRLQPGWSLERVENGNATSVNAQLLSGESQWVYVSPHSTSWVGYKFGIGDRSVWFNGKLNVEVQVYENPNQYYGSTGGTGGYSAGGAANGAAAGALVIAPAPGGSATGGNLAN